MQKEIPCECLCHTVGHVIHIVPCCEHPNAPKGQFRQPTDKEQALLNRLLEADFPGKNELASLLHRVLVKTIDENGGLELRSQVEGIAPVVQRVPVEAEGQDQDGALIHMLLHVLDGRPVELEFYRDGIGAVKTMPSPAAFELIVLPAIPKNGWIDRA